MFRASTMMGSWNGAAAARLSTGVPGLGSGATAGNTVLHPMLAALEGSPTATTIPGPALGNSELRQTMIDFMQDLIAGKTTDAALDPALVQSMLDRIDDMPGLGIGPMMFGVGVAPGVVNGTAVGNIERHETMVDLMQSVIDGGTAVTPPGFAQNMLDLIDDMPGIHLVGLHMGLNFPQIG